MLTDDEPDNVAGGTVTEMFKDGEEFRKNFDVENGTKIIRSSTIGGAT